MKMHRQCFLGFAGFVSSLALTSCSLMPQAQMDPTRFYVLSPSSTAAAPVANAPVVHLRPVELASYLRERPLIVRRGDNEIAFREYARWGEPLELGIARVLREELLIRGAAATVSTSGLRSHIDEKDFVLNVRVLACEGAAHGAVIFRAVWELSKGVSKAPIASGDFRPTDLRWDGKSEASLAAQLSRAVTGLAEEISGAVKK